MYVCVYIYWVIQKPGTSLRINNSKTNIDRNRQFEPKPSLILSRKKLFKHSFCFHYKTNLAYFPSIRRKKHLLSFLPETLPVPSFVLR